MRSLFLQTRGWCLSLAICFSIAAFAADHVQAQSSHSPRTKAASTSLFDTLADIKAFSKRLDRSETESQRIDATVDLGSLYLRIVGDPRFSRSERLQGFRGRVASRLKREQTRMTRARRKAETGRSRDPGDHNSTSMQTVTTRDDRMQSAVVDRHWHLLAQVAGAAAPSMYYSSGMHGTAGYFDRGRAAALPDHGDELVELIEIILHPDFWQTNGGAMVAHYYQPLRILVVRATTEVHEDLEHFLERLR